VQGRGTAAYTPLEQYGGDTGHTDARSDIYSLGATLYHLLTNQAPVEAKTRFLQSGTLTPPRELNPAISPRTEQAILWALAMHPHDRPDNVQTFKELLLSTGPIEMWPHVPGRREVEQIAPFNRLLMTMTVALLVLSILITLFAPLVRQP
jgi:serine/threonine-protein kinase